jgi:N-carbamoylputrescine amidase
VDRVKPLKISVCQLPDNLSPGHPAWRDLVQRIESDRPDIALLNEMPFGPWLASEAIFMADPATASIVVHESALPALRQLPAAIISSRPIRGKHKLANEAYLLADGDYRPIHHKHYFPQEPGFFEETWFIPDRPGFDVIEYSGVRIGVLLCTEIMFTEWARHYRHQGAHVLAVPRASGTLLRHWHAAARMAAIVSGCYVLSSNRVSDGVGPGPHFGGRGFVYSPTGELLAETTATKPFLCANIDLALVAHAQRNYPCYVREIEALPK